jgi:molybdopterin synthase sulfur carrier subunit
MKISMLYFSSLSETLGVKTEIIDMDTPLSETPFTVNALKNYLSQRGNKWQLFSSTNNNLLCAVDQTIATHETVIEDNQEVAFFPPVTGG